MWRCDAASAFSPAMRIPLKSKRIEFLAIALLLIATAVFLSQTPAFADDVAAAAAPTSARMNPFQFILGTVNFFLIAFFVYYVLMLRPQQLKQDEHARFLRDLKRDEEVVTSGGLLGRVSAIAPEQITVDVGSGTKLRFKPEHVFPLRAQANKAEEKAGKQLAAK